MFERIVQDIKNVKVRNIVLVRNAPKRNGRMGQSSAITNVRKNLIIKDSLYSLIWIKQSSRILHIKKKMQN